MQSLNPLHVVEIRRWGTEESAHHAEVDTVYRSELAVLPWKEDFYGIMRGGTQAVYLREAGLHLSFFHSRKVMFKPFTFST